MGQQFIINGEDVKRTLIRELSSYEKFKKYTVVYEMNNGTIMFGLSKSFDSAVIEQQTFYATGQTTINSVDAEE